MLKKLLSRRIDSFERQWGHDSGHLREILAASTPAFLKIGLAQPMMHHREDVPLEAYAAACITATLAADCGPCFELTMKMARAAGLPGALVDSIGLGDEAGMTEDARLGYAFARAVVARDVEGAGRLRGAILRKWGRRALVSLSIAVAGASFYPSLKYGMGRGRPAGGLRAALARKAA
jgi:hypothetical protein